MSSMTDYCDYILTTMETAPDEETFLQYIQDEDMHKLNRVIWLILYRLWMRTEDSR